MTRNEALERLQNLGSDRNLYDLAKSYGVTVQKHGRLNKGWIGHTLERAAGLPTSNAQAPDGEDFELKSTTFVKRGETWVPKETIRVTQFNPQAILEETFETSALWKKLQALVLVSCRHEEDGQCFVRQVSSVDITDPEVVQAIRAFWEDLRHTVCVGEIVEFHDLGRSSDWLQLRPTGTGKHVSVCPVTLEKFPSRAIYATKRLISRVLEGSGAEV